MRKCLWLALAAFVFVPTALAAQTYTKGQNVAPAFEGWRENADGTFSLMFGYMNRNWEEAPTVPVGENNMFSPGEADRGQPTHFLPRRNRWVFEVTVPADFGEQELIWTLTTNGVTEHAYGTLRPDYIVDNTVIMSETGALGAGSSDPTIRSNQPPKITLETERELQAVVGQPLELVAHIEDDGLLEADRRAAPADSLLEGEWRFSQRQLFPPVRVTVDKVNGLFFSWYVYRAEADGTAATFDPPQTKPWEDTRAGANSPWAPLWQPPEEPEDGRWVSTVTFTEPGTYVLRAHADDGGLYADEEITVVVRRRAAS